MIAQAVKVAEIDDAETDPVASSLRDNAWLDRARLGRLRGAESVLYKTVRDRRSRWLMRRSVFS